MKIERKFLEAVQRAGWNIRFVDEQSVTAGCPRQGCGVIVKLRSGAAIPQTCGRLPDWREKRINSNADFTNAMREQRLMLALAVAEVEDAAGTATDHWAKAEGENPQRQMISPIAFEVAAALGYEIVLRRVEMPAVTLGLISRTRSRTEARRRMAKRQARD